MTNFITNNSPSYLTPVYNPIQFENYFLEGTGTTPTYQFSLQFNVDVLTAQTGSSTFTCNSTNFTISRTPTQIQIPNPDILNPTTNFIYFVEEIFKNNPLFDNYQIESIESTTTPSLVFKHKIPYTTDRITFSGDPSSAFTTSSITPEYLYSAQSLSNYSVWMEVYTDNNKNIFRSTLTGTSDSNILQTTLYKVYQNDNRYRFNVSPILQSASNTDLWSTENSQSYIYFQKDLNSLNNSRFRFQESYDVQLSTGLTTTRKFNMLISAKPYFDDVWYWDASRKLPFDSEPYYNLNYNDIYLTSVTTNGVYTFLFKYLPVVDEIFDISNNYISKTFRASTSNIPASGFYKIENTLSGTVNNFLSAFTTNFTGYSTSIITKGYSQVYVTISANTYDQNLNLNSTNSDHFVSYSRILADQYNSIILPDAVSIPEILFLTDRPRTGTFICYSSTTVNKKQYSLSIFLSVFDNDPVIADSQSFRIASKIKTNGIYSDDYTYSDPISFTYTDNGLYHINIDPSLFDYDNDYQGIKFFVEYYIDLSGTTYTRQYSEEIEFLTKVVCDYQNIKTFTWLNDLGGWDNFHFIEDIETTYNRDITLISNDFNQLITETTTYEQNFQNNIEKTYKLSVVVNSNDEYNWLYQLIKSSRIYLIDDKDTETQVDDRYIPVIITNSDFKSTENNNELVLNFEYRIAKKDLSQKSI